MPDDNLFTSSETPPEGTPSGDSSGEDSSGNGTPQGLSEAEIQLMIQSSTQPLQAENQALQQELQTLRQQANQPPPVDPPKADEWIENFTGDAQGTVQATAAEIVDARFQKLVPYLEQTNATIHTSLIDMERRAVEAEYGPDAWTTHFEPVMNIRMTELQKTNPMALANAGIVKNEVLGIHGLKRNELNSLKSTNTTAATDAKEKDFEAMKSRLNISGMTGGTSAPPVNTSKELSEAEKDYVASKKLAGMDVDIQALRASAKRGTGFAEYQAEQASKGDKK